MVYFECSCGSLPVARVYFIYVTMFNCDVVYNCIAGFNPGITFDARTFLVYLRYLWWWRHGIRCQMALLDIIKIMARGGLRLVGNWEHLNNTVKEYFLPPHKPLVSFDPFLLKAEWLAGTSTQLSRFRYRLRAPAWTVSVHCSSWRLLLVLISQTLSNLT